MTIYVSEDCKKIKKENKGVKRTLQKSILYLVSKIQSMGGDINKIYNDDSIIYDRIAKGIYVFKTHGADNTQLRIVYSCECRDTDFAVYILDYTSKKKNHKEYISQFNSKYRNTDISQLKFFEFDAA